MTLSRAVDVPPPRVQSAETRARVTALLVAALWFDVLWEAARHVEGLSLPPWVAALAGLATQLAFTACEAALAAQVWRAMGTRVTWAALAPRLLAASSAEVLAVAIAAGRTTLPPALAVWLSGTRATDAALPSSGPTFAFAALGVLTLARLLLSAHVQAGVARRPFVRALTVVLALYLATRLAMWWTFDLMQGRSFQPWGQNA